MKIAIPLTDGRLSAHFVDCETFALLGADAASRTITATETVEPPLHEPVLLPHWLAEKGATTIIAAGMGSQVQDLFEQKHIRVVVGASVGTPEAIVTAYLNGVLVRGENVCDH